MTFRTFLTLSSAGLASLVFMADAQAAAPLSTDDARAMSADEFKGAISNSLFTAAHDIAHRDKRDAASALADAETSLLNGQMAGAYNNLNVFDAVKTARSDLGSGKVADAREEIRSAQKQL